MAAATSENINTFVFLDLEATGLGGHGARPKITEISLVAVHRALLLGSVSSSPMRVVDKLTLCVYPMKPIEPVAAQITGLHNDTLYYQKDFDSQLILLLKTFLHRHEQPICLIAHNGNGYDFPLLKSEILSLDDDFESDILCADSLLMFRDLDENQNSGSPDLKHSEMPVLTLGNCETPVTTARSLCESQNTGSFKRKLEFIADDDKIATIAMGRNSHKICKSSVGATVHECSSATLQNPNTDSNASLLLGKHDNNISHSVQDKPQMTTVVNSPHSTTECVQNNLDATATTHFEMSSVPDSLLLEAAAIYNESSSNESTVEVAHKNALPTISPPTHTIKNNSECDKPKLQPEIGTPHDELSTEMNVVQNAQCSENVHFHNPPVISRYVSKQKSKEAKPVLTKQSSFTRRKSFKLAAVYERVVRKPMPNAHSAEHDCLALLRICQVLSKDVCEWINTNAQKWSTVTAMYPKSPNKRKLLPPGHFPYHDGDA